MIKLIWKLANVLKELNGIKVIELSIVVIEIVINLLFIFIAVMVPIEKLSEEEYRYTFSWSSGWSSNYVVATDLDRIPLAAFDGSVVQVPLSS